MKRKSGLFGRTELSGTRWTESSQSGLDLAVDNTEGFRVLQARGGWRSKTNDRNYVTCTLKWMISSCLSSIRQLYNRPSNRPPRFKMSLPYMGNKYGDAGSGDSCNTPTPREPDINNVDVKLRSGAIVVFLQPPEGQGIQEQAGELVPCRCNIARFLTIVSCHTLPSSVTSSVLDVSERNGLLRNGSNTVYLTGGEYLRCCTLAQ